MANVHVPKVTVLTRRGLLFPRQGRQTVCATRRWAPTTPRRQPCTSSWVGPASRHHLGAAQAERGAWAPVRCPSPNPGLLPPRPTSHAVRGPFRNLSPAESSPKPQWGRCHTPRDPASSPQRPRAPARPLPLGPDLPHIRHSACCPFRVRALTLVTRAGRPSQARVPSQCHSCPCPACPALPLLQCEPPQGWSARGSRRTGQVRQGP